MLSEEAKEAIAADFALVVRWRALLARFYPIGTEF